MISKELLSEVLDSPVEIISIDENKCEIRNSISFENYQLGVSYSYLYGNKETRFMPIHELAHKCKEWAWKQGHALCTTPLMANPNIIYCWDELESSKYETISIKANTEPEAIFKACQWILDNKVTNG